MKNGHVIFFYLWWMKCSLSLRPLTCLSDEVERQILIIFTVTWYGKTWNIFLMNVGAATRRTPTSVESGPAYCLTVTIQEAAGIWWVSAPSNWSFKEVRKPPTVRRRVRPRTSKLAGMFDHCLSDFILRCAADAMFCIEVSFYAVAQSPMKHISKLLVDPMSFCLRVHAIRIRSRYIFNRDEVHETKCPNYAKLNTSSTR